MAHKSVTTRTLAAIAAFVIGCSACGDRGAAAPAPSHDDAAASGRATFDDATWVKVHSLRHELTIDLPDARAWKVDDHSRPELVALHVPTRSSLVVGTWRETDLMNRAKCEARARERGLVAKGSLTTVDDATIEFPKGYDTRMWVAIDVAGARGSDTHAKSTVGYVMAFGSRLRQCLFMRFSSAVPSDDAKALDVLSSRLAVARTRILGQMVLDPPRTQSDATVPRESTGDSPSR